jgi:hypothetical protein
MIFQPPDTQYIVILNNGGYIDKRNFLFNVETLTYFLSSADRIVSQLPCIYLGLPLRTRKPSKAMIQVLLQQIGNWLSG